MELIYYSTSTTPADKLLAKLLAKTLEQNKRALVVCETEEYQTHVNDTLWNPRAVLLPHARATDMYPEEQPILLSLSDVTPANKAEFVFYLESSDFAHAEQYNRAVIIASSLDEKRLQEAQQFAQQNSTVQLKCWKEADGKWVPA